MSQQQSDLTSARTYEIRVRGQLDSRWATWFDACSLARQQDGTTVIAGSVLDQAALYGLLAAIRDLGLPLLSVTPIEPGRPRTNPTGPGTSTTAS